MIVHLELMVAFPHAYSLYMHIHCGVRMVSFLLMRGANIQLDAGRDVTPTLFIFLFFFKNKVVSVFQTRGRGISSYITDPFDKQTGGGGGGGMEPKREGGVCLNP